jgi:hypothetical protein
VQEIDVEVKLAGHNGLAVQDCMNEISRSCCTGNKVRARETKKKNSALIFWRTRRVLLRSAAKENGTHAAT